jgi:hypothetical protein
VADHKTRLAAVALDLAYREGKPLEKSITLRADAVDFHAMVEKLAHSPIAQAKFGSSLLAVEGKETPSALPEPQ